MRQKRIVRLHEPRHSKADPRAGRLTAAVLLIIGAAAVAVILNIVLS